MKKSKLLFAVFIVLSVTLYSQSFNIAISGGYCLPLATEMHSLSTTQFGNPNYPNTYSVLTQNVTINSLGNGGNVALSLDWFSKKNIGFGFMFNTLISAPTKYSAPFTDVNYNTDNYNFTEKGFSYQLIPHLNFKHDFKAISPYIEMGMIIGITHMNESFVATDNNGNTFTSDKKYYGNVMLAFYSSLGLAFNINKSVKITFALTCSAGSYSPSSYEVTSYTVNGANQLPNLPLSIQQGSFEKDLISSYTSYTSQPGKEPKFSVPCSNLGINAGFCFVFPKQAEDKNVSKDAKTF